MPTLLHGDCLDLMKTLPDKSVDLFVCDLPYGCLSSSTKTERKRILHGKDTGTVLTTRLGGCSWDTKIDLTQFWIQVKRLCKDEHTPVLMFCSTKFGFDLYNSNPDWFRYDLVWNKSRGVGFLCANKMPLRSHEMIYVFSKKGAHYYRTDTAENKCVLSVIDSSGCKKGNHPTQKPAALYEWLIERYSKSGDTVLDPTAGSFTSVFVAERMGRTAIGMEMDKGFYDTAVEKSVEIPQ